MPCRLPIPACILNAREGEHRGEPCARGDCVGRRAGGRGWLVSMRPYLFQRDLAGVRRVHLGPPSWDGDRHDLAHLEACGPRGPFWGTDLTRMPCPSSVCLTL